MNTVTEPTTEPTAAPPNCSSGLPTAAFCINSDAAADWYLRQLAALDAERALLIEQHKAALARLDADRSGLTFLYGAQLETYVAQRIGEDKRGRKSLILPHGTCAFRSVPASVKISDPAAALHAARQQAMPDMVKTVEVLDAARYQQAARLALHKYGCLLPGVEATPAREAFRVSFGREKEA